MLAALGLAKGGPAEGQRVPASVTATPTESAIRRATGKDPSQMSPERRAVWEAWERHDRPPGYVPPTPVSAELEAKLADPIQLGRMLGLEMVKTDTGYIILRMRDQPQIYAREYRFISLWTEDRTRFPNGFQVATSFLLSDPGKPLLLVFRSDNSLNVKGRYSIPLTNPQVTIIAATGRVLRLRDETGGIVEFDVDSRTFRTP